MTQDEALALLKTGAHVFLTGEPGSGKTHTINRYTEYLREHEIDFAVTASTGIAATHVHGMTIHSWSGIGVETEFTDDELAHLAANRYVGKRIKQAKVLIIDEISMLDGTVLSLVERVCRQARKLRVPFGGLQVVLVGDFFQLPPVSKGKKESQFAFASDAWQILQPTVCYLTEQHRQEDGVFLRLLSAIRRNECDEDHVETIRERLIKLSELPDDMTRLFSHNANVDSLNSLELKKLPGKTKSFIMAARGPEALTETLKRGCLSPERLELKVGATVMFTKNNSGEGFVNGTLGTVVGFSEHATRQYPIVQTKKGARIDVEPMEWTITEGDEVLAKVTQLPLRLAWALTIHKSQGVSLDAAVMDLSQTFEYGQGYVALSRVRTLSGVHLLGINRRALEVHPVVLEIDQAFRQASDREEAELEILTKEELEERQKNFITLCGGTQEVRKVHQVSKIRKAGKVRKVKGTKSIKIGETAEKAYDTEIIREKHPHAYMAWRPEDEAKLKSLYHKGVQIKEISETLGRKPGAIRSRLKKLNLV